MTFRSLRSSSSMLYVWLHLGRTGKLILGATWEREDKIMIDHILLLSAPKLGIAISLFENMVFIKVLFKQKCIAASKGEKCKDHT
jgi:hypothetical protein